MPKHDKDITRKANCRQITHRCKNPPGNNANWIWQHIKKLTHHNKVSCIPGIKGWFNIHKLINVMHHINRIKTKNYMTISIDMEKAFDRIQHPFMIQTFKKVGFEGAYLKIITAMYDKPRANLIMIRQKQEEFQSKTRTRWSFSLPLLFNIVLQVISGAIRHKQEGIKTSKEEVKVSLFMEDMIL